MKTRISLRLEEHHGADVVRHELGIVMLHVERHNDFLSHCVLEKAIEAELEGEKSAEVARRPDLLVILSQGRTIVYIQAKRTFWRLNSPRRRFVTCHHVVLQLEVVLSVFRKKGP